MSEKVVATENVSCLVKCSASISIFAPKVLRAVVGLSLSWAAKATLGNRKNVQEGFPSLQTSVTELGMLSVVDTDSEILL